MRGLSLEWNDCCYKKHPSQSSHLSYNQESNTEGCKDFKNHLKHSHSGDKAHVPLILKNCSPIKEVEKRQWKESGRQTAPANNRVVRPGCSVYCWHSTLHKTSKNRDLLASETTDHHRDRHYNAMNATDPRAWASSLRIQRTERKIIHYMLLGYKHQLTM